MLRSPMRVHFIASLLLLSSCGGSQARGPTAPAEKVESLPVLTSMTVSLSAASVQVGQHVTATLAAVDEVGRSMTVGIIAWTTSQPTVATISPDGVVTAVTSGQTNVTARVGTVQAHATIVVTPFPPGPVPVASVSVAPSSATIAIGQSMQLAAKPKDYAGNLLADRAVTWASSESAVATVSPNGFVTALAVGTAIIEATSEAGRGGMVIHVTAAVDTEIIVSVMAPTPGAVVGDTVGAVSTVRSPFPITSVVASAGGRQAPMTFGPIGGEGRAQGWSVALDISTLPFGAYALVVTAIDSRGHRGVTAVAFVRNPRVPGGSKAPAGSK